MINKAEIDRVSDELGIHASNVQRDYVFGWLLSGIYRRDNPLAHQLVLKGGNCFRKGYFPQARFSDDLDFSTAQPLDQTQFRASVNQALSVAREQSGVDFLLDETRVAFRRAIDGETNLWESRVYFRSFYGEEETTLRVKMDVGEYDRIYLPVQARRLIHGYSDGGECCADIKCVKLEELLASKLNALLHRRHSADLYDFVHAVFFQKQLDVSRLEIIRTFLKKTIYEGSPIDAKGLLLQYPFQAIREFWNKCLFCPKPAVFAFDDAVGWYRQLIADVFSLIEPRFDAIGFGGRYFPAAQRDLIMEAGRLRKTLKVSYDGHVRAVEPYAIAYKRRKDGLAREYFYAWDRTGGSSGQVGMKSFTADKLRHVEIAGGSFDPRFPIELGKDGGYFSGSGFSPGYRGTSMRTSSSSLNHAVKCPYCGKKFRRAKLNQRRLNPHKNAYGSPCHGRLGFAV